MKKPDTYGLHLFLWLPSFTTSRAIWSSSIQASCSSVNCFVNILRRTGTNDLDIVQYADRPPAEVSMVACNFQVCEQRSICFERRFSGSSIIFRALSNRNVSSECESTYSSYPASSLMPPSPIQRSSSSSHPQFGPITNPSSSSYYLYSADS